MYVYEAKFIFSVSACIWICSNNIQNNINNGTDYA